MFNTLSGASVLAANDPFGAAADLGLEKRCVPQIFNRQSVPLSRDGSRPTQWGSASRGLEISALNDLNLVLNRLKLALPSLRRS